MDLNQTSDQMEMFGYTAEGAQQEADKFVGEAGNLEEDISKAASSLVPFYDSGVNIANVAQEYMKPEQERDYDYIKSQFTEAGQSAAIEGGLLLMGGVAGKYGAKGIKALADKVKQYEINPNVMSAFGAGAIRKKTSLTPDDFGYIEDNPVTKGYGGSEDWLSGKIKQANESKNLLDGATTALLGTSKDKPLFLDTDFISSLKGARDEVRKKGEPQYDRLKKTVDKEGFDPNKTILIEVNHKGEAYIVEGNTRAALAKELGVPNIKAEIRYKNGAELVDSPFSPQNIIEKSSKLSYPEALAISKKLDEEMISVFPKPERMFPEESRPKGGDYLNPATGEVLSGRNVSSAKLSISPEGKPSFKVSNDNVEEVGSVGKGKTQIKTNLFKKKAGWKWTKAPEGMEDIATLISVENRGKHFYTIETDFSKGVNLKKYPNSKTEPRLRPTVVGEIEIGPQIGNISVRGKEHPVYQSIRTFNKGGAVMDDQMQMAFMDEGGIADDGMDVDPVSGNEVPPGSLAEEVRDDIPAQLSEGEYVVPADVVRYYGVKFFEDLRDQAKMGLAEMEANGRIGGEPVPAGGPINDEELSEQEMSAIRQMMTGMAEGGEVQNPYLQQQQLYSQPRPAPIDEKRNTTITGINPVENQMPMQSMADGGQVQGYQDSGDVMKDAPSFVQNQFDPAQYGLGYSFMGQPQQAGTTLSQAPQGQSFTVLYHPEYATNGKSKTFYLPRDSAVYQEYLGMGYTKQMPMTGPAGQGETPTTDTPVTTDLTGSTVTTGSGPKGSSSGGGKTPTPEKIDYTTYEPDELLEAFDQNRKTRIALTALGAVNPIIALFGQGATRAQEKEIIAAMKGKDMEIPKDEGGIVDNITNFVSGLFGKDKNEIKNKLPPQTIGEFGKSTTREARNIKPSKNISDKRKGSGMGPSKVKSTVDSRSGQRIYTSKGTKPVRSQTGASTSSAAKTSAKKSLEKAGFKPGTYKGGRAEGGLMNKKGKK